MSPSSAARAPATLAGRSWTSQRRLLKQINPDAERNRSLALPSSPFLPLHIRIEMEQELSRLAAQTVIEGWACAYGKARVQREHFEPARNSPSRTAVVLEGPEHCEQPAHSARVILVPESPKRECPIVGEEALPNAPE